MKRFMYSLGFFLAIFANFAALNVATPAETLAKALTYTIVDVANDKNVHLKFSGSDYATSGTTTYCHIQISNVAGDDLEEISSCTNNEHSDVATKCVRTCSNAAIQMPYNQFSPRTMYTAIFENADAAAASAKIKTGTVFGLDIPLLVNPKITISITAENRLRMPVITCAAVSCPITYKGVVYAAGSTSGADCVTATTTSSADEVEFDLMIPHYEMKCVNYPSFFYKMQNNYTMSTMDVYKPQYYVTYNKEKTKYLLKFTNKFSYEICRFGIKEESIAIDSTIKEDYTSNCGGEGKACYAPCHDVELIFTTSKNVVEILIQPRFASLGKTDSKYFGYTQKKFVVTETDAASDAGKLLYGKTATGVTLNVPLFKPANDADKFTECTVEHYVADKPTPETATDETKCGTTTPTECATDCAAALNIVGLLSGKPYILEITASSSAASGAVTAGFKEHIFYRTNGATDKSFDTTAPAVTETSVSIKALTGDPPLLKTDATCAYYISPRGKNVFTCVKCESGYPCRGFCKETHTVNHLTPGTQYDLLVAAHVGYGFKKYQIETSFYTLTLQHQFMNKGFKVTGVLSTAFDDVVCNYKVKVKRGTDFVQINECPPPVATAPAAGTATTTGAETGANAGAATGSTNGAATGSTNGAATGSTNEAATEAATGATAGSTTGSGTGSSPGVGTGAGASVATAGSRLSKFTVARSADAQATTTENTTPTTPTMPACSAAPLCSEILIADGYEADKEYQVLVTAVGRSIETTINIPAYPLPTDPTDTAKQMIVEITRDGTTFKVVSVLPTGVAENSLCKWELRNWEDPSKPIIKKCTVIADDECTVFPPCKEITISGVADSNDYHMSVIHSTDESIAGVGTIKKGADSNKSTSSQTLIILVAVPVVIVLAGLGFYFGYMKNKN